MSELSENTALIKARIIYEHWNESDGDEAELAIGIYNLAAHYEALLKDYDLLEARIERLKTYAQKLEGHHTAYDAMDWRGALGLDDELASWLIPKEHHALLAPQEELINE
jgi:hypothetical protein